MSFGDATQTFTLLTVGDGLVSQMPALIVSTAAGLMVSKAGVEGATDKALMRQLSFYPQALGMAAAVMGVVAILPGMPTMVFGGLSGATGALAYYAFKRKDARTAVEHGAGSQGQGRHHAQGRADFHRAGAGSAAHRTGLWPVAADQRCAGPPHHRPDQGAAPSAGAGDGLRHAGGAHPRQYAAGRQRVSHPHQGIRFRQGRTFPRLLSHHGSQGPAHRPARHPHHRARLRPARHLGHRIAARGSLVPRLHRGRSRHGAHHPSHRSAQEPHVRAALLCGDQEAARRSAAGEQEAGGRTDPVADLGHRRAARAADPAVRTRLDPRSARHPGRHRRSGGPHQERALYHRACAHPAGAPALPRQSVAGRLSAAAGPVARLGAGLLRIHCRPGRGAAAGDGAVAASAIHPDRARALRGSHRQE